ncbi:hypothetical protein DACRYDRAFT_25227 [Dacryopinax primogenitus]|uniref:Protein kinase domain-containing protein n=1 Tax=Dacryopinax primogenitus (strain DJM 731) TaxID=1858805 RepID=M5FPI5_DACPD|nr:uncharacterized protein DACRYDRAFT_25227 [Dacryopinax primogenitus]EJT97098.1 hypothetical protein DACRYDRAFT_25227 [Dacryopinax primogenitus]
MGEMSRGEEFYPPDFGGEGLEAHVRYWSKMQEAACAARPLMVGRKLVPDGLWNADLNDAPDFHSKPEDQLPGDHWLCKYKRPAITNAQRILKDCFTLIEPIRTGTDEYAQVWLAQCTPVDPDPNLPDRSIVIKFFQESLFLIPGIYEWTLGEYFKASDLIIRELWANTRLATLQGTILPHSYGFFQFTFTYEDAQELVCGHAMEFISGEPLTESLVRQSPFYSTPKQRELQISRLLHCISEIHWRCVAHGDLRPSNSLVPHDHPEIFVIIDFGLEGWNDLFVGPE